MKRLGVNIDHVATLRNARGEKHPDPIYAAKYVSKCGADSVTIHLREDRRHINDHDAQKICDLKGIQVNLEVSMNREIIRKALKIKPNFICVVPEKREEITTEGGLNLKDNLGELKSIIKKFKKNKIRTSLFINPSLKDMRLASMLEVDCVEIHTGKLANLVKQKKNHFSELARIKNSSKLASNLKLEVHAGHGLDFKTTKMLTKINEIREFNIGHFIIGESIFLGISNVIKEFKKLLKNK